MANKYVAIIDAGSTSSRLFIYQWDTVREEERYTKPVKFKTILNGQGKAETRRGQGGIHTKVVDPDAVDIVCANANMQNYLAGILNEGVRVLGAAGVADANSVPLYVMATAGVRQKLDGADRGNAQQLAIMKCAWNAIGILRGTDGREVYKIGNDATSTAHSFAIKEALEGVYAWIAVNHGRYQPDQMPGILELGGKSMQIAFADPTIDISNDGVDDANGYFSRPVCLFKSRHKLRTRSWVLGSEESRVGAVEKQLIKTVLPNTPVFNPCLPHHETATIYNSNPPGGGAANRRESVGSGDFAKCLALAHSYIDNNLNANNQPLIPNNKPFPALDIEPFTKRFYGVSTFWYTWDFFSQSGHYDVHGAYDPKLFRQAVDEYCNGSWLQPFGWNEDGARDGNFINKHCFAAAWMMALLHSRKGFNLRLSDYETWQGLIRFPSTPDLASRSSWTIGAATMVARNGDPIVFCRPQVVVPQGQVGGQLVIEDESDLDKPYPPPQFSQPLVNPYDDSTTSPAITTTITYPDEGNTAQPYPPTTTPPAPTVTITVTVTKSPLSTSGASPHSVPGLTIDTSNMFSKRLAYGVLVIALALLAYRRLSARYHAAVQLPVINTEKKHRGSPSHHASLPAGPEDASIA